MKKVLVVGASENPERYSNKAIRALLAHNYNVVALGTRKGKVLGLDFETEKLNFENVDTVTMYVGPQNQTELIDYLITKIVPRRIIFNPGTENDDFVRRAEKAGIYCEIACTLVLLSIGEF